MNPKRLPITGLPIGQVPAGWLVCGDPGRATKIASYLDNAELISDQREYRAYRGYFQGVEIGVGSHGVGAPGAAIAFEEMVAAGGRCLLRVGSCGGLQPDIQAGMLIIASAAVQNTGYGLQVAPAGYPAVPDTSLTYALAQTGKPYQARLGIVLTCDNFYNGVETAYTPHYQRLSQANVLAVEMECAALFIVGNLRRVATAAILAVDGNVLVTGESMDDYAPHRPVVAQAIENGIHIALKTITQWQP